MSVQKVHCPKCEERTICVNVVYERASESNNMTANHYAESCDVECSACGYELSMQEVNEAEKTGIVDERTPSSEYDDH